MLTERLAATHVPTLEKTLQTQFDVPVSQHPCTEPNKDAEPYLGGIHASEPKITLLGLINTLISKHAPSKLLEKNIQLQAWVELVLTELQKNPSLLLNPYLQLAITQLYWGRNTNFIAEQGTFSESTDPSTLYAQLLIILTPKKAGIQTVRKFSVDKGVPARHNQYVRNDSESTSDSSPEETKFYHGTETRCGLPMLQYSLSSSVLVSLQKQFFLAVTHIAELDKQKQVLADNITSQQKDIFGLERQAQAGEFDPRTLSQHLKVAAGSEQGAKLEQSMLMSKIAEVVRFTISAYPQRVDSLSNREFEDYQTHISNLQDRELAILFLKSMGLNQDATAALLGEEDSQSIQTYCDQHSLSDAQRTLLFYKLTQVNPYQELLVEAEGQLDELAQENKDDFVAILKYLPGLAAKVEQYQKLVNKSYFTVRSEGRKLNYALIREILRTADLPVGIVSIEVKNVKVPDVRHLYLLHKARQSVVG